MLARLQNAQHIHGMGEGREERHEGMCEFSARSTNGFYFFMNKVMYKKYVMRINIIMMYNNDV